MSWRLDLSDDPLHAIHLLAGDPACVAAWTTPREVLFYAEHNGAFYGRQDGLVDDLRAPNGAYLPVVDTGTRRIHTSYDGRVRLYQDERLVLEVDGQRSELARNGSAPFVAVALDRELATLAALSADGLLHIYQQHIYVGAYSLETDGLRHVLVPDAADRIIVVGDVCLRTVDMSGQVDHSVALSTPVDAAACTPDGDLIVIAQQAFLRAYDWDLTLIRQGDAWDLLAWAEPLQLLVDPPCYGAGVGTLALNNAGILAFALGGCLCVTDINALTPVPQPRVLF